MAEYTPTTKELRDEYVYGQLDRATSPRITELSLGGEFDRWLAQHDAEVAAKALEDAADEFEAIEQRYAIVHSPVAWLRERAGSCAPSSPSPSRRTSTTASPGCAETWPSEVGSHKQSSAHQVGMSSQNTVRAGDVIRTAEELDALPDKAVVLDEHEEPWQKLGEGLWCGSAGGPMSGSALLRTRTDEVTVLYVPGEQPGPFTDQALAEAWRRFPDGIDVETGEPVDDYGYPATAREAFIAGAEWAAARAETTTATTEEWAHRLENGGAMIWPTREQAEADREDYLSRPRDPFEPRPPASAGIWRREVTAWTEVDRG